LELINDSDGVMVVFCGFDELDVGAWLGQVACAALGSFVKNYGSTPPTSY
jgi:hypothetical protein